MTPYYIMLVILFFCVYLEESAKTEKNKNRIFIFALIPFLVLLACREKSVGTDTENYFQSYIAMTDYDYSQFLLMDDFGFDRVEKGYKVYMWLLTRISCDGQFLLLVTALISSVALYHFIKENARNRSLALFFFITLGFFQFAMSGIRQTLAISITLFGCRYIKENNLIKFFLVILLALQFHKSAIFLLPMFFAARIKTNSINVNLAILAIIVLYFVANDLFVFVGEMMDYDYGVEQTGNGFVFFSMVLLITIISLIFRKKLMTTKSSNSIFINLNLISLATWVLRLVSRTAERVSLYFMPYTYVLLEQIISSQPKRHRRTYMMIVLVVAAVLFIYRMSYQIDLNNYIFYWQ